MNDKDRDQRNAMAARGYFQAFQVVEKSIGRVLKGENLAWLARKIIVSGTGKCSRQA